MFRLTQRREPTTVAIRAMGVTSGLAAQLYQPVRFVAMVGIPVIRHKLHQALETAHEVSVGRHESETSGYPQHMRIDDEDAFVQRAEIPRARRVQVPENRTKKEQRAASSVISVEACALKSASNDTIFDATEVFTQCERL